MGKDIKAVVVGDTNVGKSCLLISYTTNSFPGEHVPTVFDNYTAFALIDGIPVNIGLWDTAGSSEYATLRPLSYPGTDVFIICFSIFQPKSFESVQQVWYKEIKEACPDVPVLLVGTKADLRNTQSAVDELQARGEEPITTTAGEGLAKAIEADMYIECSAKTQTNISSIFEEAVRCALRTQGVTTLASGPGLGQGSGDGSGSSGTGGASQRKSDDKRKAKADKKKEECLIC